VLGRDGMGMLGVGGTTAAIWAPTARLIAVWSSDGFGGTGSESSFGDANASRRIEILTVSMLSEAPVK
jgi:hypothetical protein